MRTHRSLDALFPRTRQQVLATTLLHPERSWYLSDLARHLRVRPSSLQRELHDLVEAGILRRREDGNRVYVQADTDSPFLVELQGLLTKTAGLLDVLRDALAPFAERIRVAFVYGSVARAKERATSDVDLLIVGDVALSEIAARLRDTEEKLGRPVNPTLVREDEFATKVKAGHHFLRSVLESPKLFLLGSDTDLVSTPREKSRAAARDQLAGTYRPARGGQAGSTRRIDPRPLR